MYWAWSWSCMEAFPNERIESVPSFVFAFSQFATAFFTIPQEEKKWHGEW